MKVVPSNICSDVPVNPPKKIVNRNANNILEAIAKILPT